MVRSLFATCLVVGLGLAAPAMLREGKRGDDCNSETLPGAQTSYAQAAQSTYPQAAQTTSAQAAQTTSAQAAQTTSAEAAQTTSSQAAQTTGSSQGSGYSTQPGNSEGSGYSTQPSNPQGSSSPSQPGNPQGSSSPSQPSNPQGTAYPSQPSNPQGTGYPSQPSSPSQPTSASQPSSSGTPGGSGGGATPGGPYKTYTGSGADWPTKAQWVGDFETLWKANEPAMQISCQSNGWGANNSPTEIQSIHDNLKSVASANGFDPRFLLAIMMQESKGCVRVKTTANAHPNPGLMQSGGTTSCMGVNPCPDSQIKAMIEDGVTGPDGLSTTMAKATGSADGLKLYRAAVLYNSGINLDVSTTLAGPGAATPCYASDIVNRLLGTLTGGASPCTAAS